MKNVIHIFGASGSGTTTLGKRIATEFGFQFMDTDDYYWLPTSPPYTQKRPGAQRVALMIDKINHAENVVISGSLTDWGDALIPYFTLAIRVHTDTSLRLQRLKLREQKAFGARIEQGGDMYCNHLEFLDWASGYDTGDMSTRSKAKHDAWQELLCCERLDLDGTDLVHCDLSLIKQKIKI